MGLVDRKLKAAGVSSGAYGDEVAVERWKDEDGTPVLFVQSFSDDPAHPTSAMIPWKEMWDATQDHIKGRVAQVTPSVTRNYNGVDPYRRISGESTATRLARINREVKAGADPVKHR